MCLCRYAHGRPCSATICNIPYLIGLLYASLTDQFLEDKQMTDELTTSEAIRSRLRGLCPHCDQGHLFNGFLAVKAQCEVCGLDFRVSNSSRKLGRSVIGIIGVIAAALICRIQVGYSPAIWVHLATALPPALLVCALPLRPLKGWLISSQLFLKLEAEKNMEQAMLKNVA